MNILEFMTTIWGALLTGLIGYIIGSIWSIRTLLDKIKSNEWFKKDEEENE